MSKSCNIFSPTFTSLSFRATDLISRSLIHLDVTLVSGVSFCPVFPSPSAERCGPFVRALCVSVWALIQVSISVPDQAVWIIVALQCRLKLGSMVPPDFSLFSAVLDLADLFGVLTASRKGCIYLLQGEGPPAVGGNQGLSGQVKSCLRSLPPSD